MNRDPPPLELPDDTQDQTVTDDKDHEVRGVDSRCTAFTVPGFQEELAGAVEHVTNEEKADTQVW